MVINHSQEKCVKEQGEKVMGNNKKRSMNIQLFAEADGANAQDNNGGTQPSIDYESEYKKMLAEIDSYKAEVEKQKGLKDKYASENADYKKKELAKMSDDEKKAKEYQDLVDSANQMKAELAQMKLEKDLLANGFTTEESEKLIKANISIGDMKVLTDIIKEKVDLAVKSAKAELIKDTTPSSPMGNTDGKAQPLSYAERLAKQNMSEDSTSNQIKEFYKK